MRFNSYCSCYVWIFSFLPKKPISICVQFKGNKNRKKSWKPGNNFPKKSEICFYFLSQYIYNRWKWSWYSFLFFRRKKSLSFYASIHSNFNFFFKSNVKLLNEHMNERKTAYCFKNWPLMNTCWDLCECTWKWKKKEGKKCVRLSGCVVNNNSFEVRRSLLLFLRIWIPNITEICTCIQTNTRKLKKKERTFTDMHRHRLRHHSMHIRTYREEGSERERKSHKNKNEKNISSQLLPIDNCDNIISASLFFNSYCQLLLLVLLFSFSLCNNWIIMRAQTGKIDDAAADDEDERMCIKKEQTCDRFKIAGSCIGNKSNQLTLFLYLSLAFSLIREKWAEDIKWQTRIVYEDSVRILFVFLSFFLFP